MVSANLSHGNIQAYSSVSMDIFKDQLMRLMIVVEIFMLQIFMDIEFKNLILFSLSGKSWIIFYSSGFRYPYGMHVDSNDKIYVTDFYNYAVQTI